MSVRDELDLVEVLRVVAAPAARALLRPGELDSIAVEWAAFRVSGWEQTAPDGEGAFFEVGFMSAEEFARVPRRDVVRLVLRVQARGEAMTYEIADADDTDEIDLNWHADEFYEHLQDFIVESKFGWGQLRGRA